MATKEPQLTVRIEGISPLLLHNAIYSVNPLSNLSKVMKQFTGKRNKTDIMHETIAKIEWAGGFYLGTPPRFSENNDGTVLIENDESPIIPGFVLEAMLRAAAKKTRKGKDVQAGLFILNDSPLEYSGPKNLEELWHKGDWTDQQPVTVQRSKIIRTRPIFREWAVTFQIDYDPDLLNEIDILTFLNTGGSHIGLCDYRPRYGRFSYEVL